MIYLQHPKLLSCRKGDSKAGSQTQIYPMVK